jgi:Initiator Replication protein
MRPSQGNGKSGSLFNVQSELRVHLAGIKEAPSGIYGAEAGQ